MCWLFSRRMTKGEKGWPWDARWVKMWKYLLSRSRWNRGIYFYLSLRSFPLRVPSAICSPFQDDHSYVLMKYWLVDSEEWSDRIERQNVIHLSNILDPRHQIMIVDINIAFYIPVTSPFLHCNATLVPFISKGQMGRRLQGILQGRISINPHSSYILLRSLCKHRPDFHRHSLVFEERQCRSGAALSLPRINLSIYICQISRRNSLYSLAPCTVSFG